MISNAPCSVISMRFRYLRPVIGRWCTRDPWHSLHITQSYDYCAGAPTAYSDPLGLVPQRLTAEVYSVHSEVFVFPGPGNGYGIFAEWRRCCELACNTDPTARGISACCGTPPRPTACFCHGDSFAANDGGLGHPSAFDATPPQSVQEIERDCVLAHEDAHNKKRPDVCKNLAAGAVIITSDEEERHAEEAQAHKSELDCLRNTPCPDAECDVWKEALEILNQKSIEFYRPTPSPLVRLLRGY